MVKLFEQFVKEDLAGEYISEKLGLSSVVKSAGDKIAEQTRIDIYTKANYTIRSKEDKPWSTSYNYYFVEAEDSELLKRFAADGITLNLILDVGPTLFKKDIYSEANTYDRPKKGKDGKTMIIINVSMDMEPGIYDKNFKRGAESALVEIKALMYHELTHSDEFKKRSDNKAYVNTSKDRAALVGSQKVQSMLTSASKEDIPYFFTRFFQLMYIATSYEVNAFAAMVVSDMERHKFKDRSEFNTMRDYITSKHDTLVKRQAELIKTNSWINYTKLKEFSMADFIMKLEGFGMPFGKFFIALTSASNSAATDIIVKSIKLNQEIDDSEKNNMIKSMDDVIDMLRKQKQSDPVDQMRNVAKKITDAKEKLQKKLLRMVTYE